MKRSTILLGLALLISPTEVALADDDEFKVPIDVLDDDGKKIGHVPIGF